MSDDLTPDTTPEQPVEQTHEQPSAISTTSVDEPVDKLAIARDAARANALAKHDVHNCLCPYCRGARKRQNIPSPPKAETPKVAKPSPSTPTPTPTTTSTTTPANDVIHDRDKCPCTTCSEWRTDRARKAAEARYAKEAAASYDWESAPLSEAETRLSDMRKEIERGARALSQRYNTANDKYVKCATCGKDIPNGLWVMQKTQKNADTGLYQNIFFCTAGCVNLYSGSPHQHGPTTGEPTGLHPEHARNKVAAKAAN